MQYLQTFKEAKLSRPIILMFRFHTWLCSGGMAEMWHPFRDHRGTASRGDTQIWNARDGLLFVLGTNHPSKSKLWEPWGTNLPKHHPEAPQWPLGRWAAASSWLPAGLGHLQALPPTGCVTSAALMIHGAISSPFTAEKQKSHLARACNPSAHGALTAEVIGGGGKKGGRKKNKKERERKKEQCAIGTALEMEKVLKACNIHQGWIHKCHILNKPSKRQWQRKGALLQESLSFSFAAVRNLFFASHSISHYSINEVTSHSYWLACQSPCLIP